MLMDFPVVVQYLRVPTPGTLVCPWREINRLCVMESNRYPEPCFNNTDLYYMCDVTFCRASVHCLPFIYTAFTPRSLCYLLSSDVMHLPSLSSCVCMSSHLPFFSVLALPFFYYFQMFWPFGWPVCVCAGTCVMATIKK